MQNQSNQQQLRLCMECNQPETPDNKFRSPLGQWHLCQKCLNGIALKLKQFRQNKPKLYPQIQNIIEGLYLGNQDAAVDQQTIQKYQIRAVCVCGSYLQTPFETKKMEGKFQNIMYIKHQISDFQDQKIIDLFDDNCEWIQERLKQGRNILVHCAAGVSRSASFVIAYLMNKKQMLYPDALRYVKERRKVICPNSGFKVQLQQYGNQLINRKLGSQFQQQKKVQNGVRKEKESKIQEQQQGIIQKDRQNQVNSVNLKTPQSNDSQSRIQ